MADQNINPKEEKGASTEHINIKVVDANNQETFFKLKKSTPLSKLMQAYAKRQGITDSKSIRFMFDGQRIEESDTPEGLGMENNDIIDVMIQQTGGF